MTAMEAYLRLHSYKIVQMSHTIMSLSVHDPLGQTIVVEEGNEQNGILNVNKATKLTAYFDLCKGGDPDTHDLTYDRVPYRYKFVTKNYLTFIFRWSSKERMWIKRHKFIAEDVSKSTMFARVYTVSPNKHELYAIRLVF